MILQNNLFEQDSLPEIATDLKMDIFDVLSKMADRSRTEPHGAERQYCADGILSLHDNFFIEELKKLGLDDDIIECLLEEPVTERDAYLKYYRSRDN
jgi:hypothetical protein